MKKILGIMVLGLLLCSNAYAEIITLDCKFISGIKTDDKYQTEKKLVNEMNKIVILDTKLEKIIKADHHGGDKYYWETDTSHGRDSWSETDISWESFYFKDSEKKTVIMLYTAHINRVSGQMETSFLFRYPGNEDYHKLTENKYQCSIKDKLF